MSTGVCVCMLVVKRSSFACNWRPLGINKLHLNMHIPCSRSINMPGFNNTFSNIALIESVNRATLCELAEFFLHSCKWGPVCGLAINICRKGRPASHRRTGNSRYIIEVDLCCRCVSGCSQKRATRTEQIKANFTTTFLKYTFKI